MTLELYVQNPSNRESSVFWSSHIDSHEFSAGCLVINASISTTFNVSFDFICGAIKREK